MVDRVELDMEQTKEAWLFTAWHAGRLAASLTVTPHGDTLMIHNQIYNWGRHLYREYVCSFIAIRDLLRPYGYRLIMAVSDHADEKMRRYWRLMGFECFGEMNQQGALLDFAVMEV